MLIKATYVPPQALRKRNAVVEAELAELEKEVALREEMERALKESVREMERQLRRASKGGWRWAWSNAWVRFMGPLPGSLKHGSPPSPSRPSPL